MNLDPHKRGRVDLAPLPKYQVLGVGVDQGRIFERRVGRLGEYLVRLQHHTTR